MYFAKSCKYFSSEVNYCKFLPLQRERDIFPLSFLEKARENMVGGPYIVFTRKAFLDETFVRDSTNWCKNLVGELMLVNFILSLCVKQCQMVCTKDGCWIQNLESLNRVISTQKFLKTWSCHTFSESDNSVRWKASKRRIYSEKMMHIDFMVFVDTATMCLKP